MSWFNLKDLKFILLPQPCVQVDAFQDAWDVLAEDHVVGD